MDKILGLDVLQLHLTNQGMDAIAKLSNGMDICNAIEGDLVFAAIDNYQSICISGEFVFETSNSSNETSFDIRKGTQMIKSVFNLVKFARRSIHISSKN